MTDTLRRPAAVTKPSPAPRRRGRTPAARIRRVLFYLLVLLIAGYLLFPIYWAAKTAVSADQEIYATPAAYLPHSFTMQHFNNALSDPRFLRSIVNSLIVGGSVTAISVLVGSFAAYALGRFTFRGRSTMRYVILAMSIFPQIAILGSLYKLLTATHLYNTLPALIGTYLIFILPFTVWTMTSFFQQLPKELEEAAYIDGASWGRMFRSVLLPLVMPGLVATSVFSFITAWNEFIFAMTLLGGASENYTVAIGLKQFFGEHTNEWGYIMAASTIITIPVMIFFVIVQRRLSAGLVAGAVKG